MPAKQLSGGLLFVFDAVAVHQLQKGLRGITLKRGDAERRIVRKEVGWCAVQVGEITTAASRHQYLATGPGCMVDDQYFPPAIASGRCAHKAGGAGADNDHVEG